MPNVNEIHQILPRAIRDRLELFPDAALLTLTPGSLSSKNYDLVGYAAQLWNRVNGHSHWISDAEFQRWARDFFANLAFMRSEQLSTTYGPHIIDSILAMRAGFRALGWTESEALAAKWLRSCAAYLGAGSVPWSGRDLDAKSDSTVGPACLIATGPPSARQSGRPWVCWAGARSAENTGLREATAGQYRWYMPDTTVHQLLGLALGRVSESEIAKACVARGCWSSWLSPEDQATLGKAVEMDIPARRAVWTWTEPYRLDVPYAFLVTTEGVACVNLRSRGGSTASCEVSASERGRSWWIFGNTGTRQVAEPCESQIDLDARQVTVQRIDKALKAVTGPLPGGDILLLTYADADGFRHEIGGEPKPVEPPAGDNPSPTDQDSRKVREKNNRTFEYIIGGIALAVILYALLF